MARKVRIVLTEIIETIDELQSATAAKSLQDFKGDWLLRLATQRALEIISEASRHIPDELLSVAPDVRWKQIRGVGNILRHEYHKIADEIIWSVVAEHLSPLRSAVLAIRDQLDER